MLGTNNLAYFAAIAVTKKKRFKRFVTLTVPSCCCCCKISYSVCPKQFYSDSGRL